MTQEDKAKAYDELIKDIKQIIFNHEGGKLYNLLEEKNEKQLNPYSGISFKYKGHTWGMCARDNGVDILLDNQLIKHFKYNSLSNKQGKSAVEAINEEKVNNANKVNTNKVKPKFKIGDWIINKVSNSVYQIIGYENNTYRIRKPDCIYYELLCVIDETYRLWHITDAKDGDIIVTGFGNIFIFKGIQDYTIFDYCGLYYGKININASHVNESCATDFPTNYTPATKEQRDLLIKALNDAGYTFDFDKKEVKSIKPKFHKGDYIASERGSFSFIANVLDNKYEIENLNHKKVFPDIDYIDKRYHLYTIKDSKVGDVLSTKDNIFIFNHDNKAIVGIPKSCWNIIGYSELKFGFAFNIKDVHPATSDECDKLKEVMINYLSKYGK